MAVSAQIATTLSPKWLAAFPWSAPRPEEAPGPGSSSLFDEAGSPPIGARNGFLLRLMTWAGQGKTVRSAGAVASSQSDAPATPARPAPETAAQLLQGLFDNLHEEVALLDADGSVMAVNAAWRDAFHAEGRDQLRGGIGLDYLALCARLSPDLGQPAFRQGVKAAMDGRVSTFAYEFAAPIGEWSRPRRVRLTHLTPSGVEFLIVIHEDVETDDGSASTAQEVLTAQEAERQRIAIELHDSTSQHLAALGLGVVRLRRLLGDRGDEVLEDMSRSIAEVMKEIRVLSFLKRPVELERDGLAATAQAFVRGFGIRTGLKAGIAIEGTLDGLPPAVEHAAFRILQESLSNVFRHALATAVDVALTRSDERLVLRVADNGRGVPGLENGDLSKVSLGVGIVGMQTRVAQFGGRLEIANGARGAIVVAMLPLGPQSSSRPAPRPRATDAGHTDRQAGAYWPAKYERLARALPEPTSTRMADVLLAAFASA